jgi:hypothetical protein
MRLVVVATMCVLLVISCEMGSALKARHHELFCCHAPN